MTPPLAATLAMVATIMERASSPWWVIGSAAVVLHGAETPVVDVDVLLGPEDAPGIFAAFAVPIAPGRAAGRFRSDVFGCARSAPLAIELMVGLHVRDGSAWTLVRPRTRTALAGVFVPERVELATLLRRFGRDKDLARAALLELTS